MTVARGVGTSPVGANDPALSEVERALLSRAGINEGGPRRSDIWGTVAFGGNKALTFQPRTGLIVSWSQ
jgi:hypothetical protein